MQCCESHDVAVRLFARCCDVLDSSLTLPSRCRLFSVSNNNLTVYQCVPTALGVAGVSFSYDGCTLAPGCGPNSTAALPSPKAAGQRSNTGAIVGAVVGSVGGVVLLAAVLWLVHFRVNKGRAFTAAQPLRTHASGFDSPPTLA